MAVNRGKEFEQQVREAFERVPDTAVLRLIDPQAGYSGVSNICDFVMYNHSTIYFIECKCHYGNTLPFNCITQNQWSGLRKMAKIPGVVAGYFVWFIDHDLTVFVSSDTMYSLMCEGKRSLSVNDARIVGVQIPGTKRRILYDYDVRDFLITGGANERECL